MNTNDFGNRLKEVMNLRGIKQIELAEKTGISRGALSSYISGRWEAKSNNLYKLAYALNVSPAWLLGLDSTMKQNTSNNHIIGARIIEARKAKNITAKELADKIHVAASTISRYENGEINKIKMPVIDAIARALNVNPMWILGKSKYPDKNDTIKYMKTNELIAARRKELGMTLEEVAQTVGVGKSTVKKWESGYIKNMRRDKMALLAKALKLSPLDLLSDEVPTDKQSIHCLPELTKSDEREIESDLEDMMNAVASAAYDNKEEMEDAEAFKATIKAAMIQAKKIAKKKYTPKKYRKG